MTWSDIMKLFDAFLKPNKLCKSKKFETTANRWKYICKLLTGTLKPPEIFNLDFLLNHQGDNNKTIYTTRVTHCQWQHILLVLGGDFALEGHVTIFASVGFLMVLNHAFTNQYRQNVNLNIRNRYKLMANELCALSSWCYSTSHGGAFKIGVTGIRPNHSDHDVRHAGYDNK